jgi:hypothetical protein
MQNILARLEHFLKFPLLRKPMLGLEEAFKDGVLYLLDHIVEDPVLSNSTRQLWHRSLAQSYSYKKTIPSERRCHLEVFLTYSSGWSEPYSNWFRVSR